MKTEKKDKFDKIQKQRRPLPQPTKIIPSKKKYNRKKIKEDN